MRHQHCPIELSAPPRRAAEDEQALARERPVESRRAQGAYYTPRELVEAVLDLLEPLVPTRGGLAIVDPACGAGAFLVAAAERFPRARLFGLELDDTAASLCRQRLPPNAHIRRGDALGGGLRALTDELRPDEHELWLGNPPYNGTSTVLSRPADYAQLQSLLGTALPPGRSLRDDFAFFLLMARRRLEHRAGHLAFVTPTTLLDAYLYAPLREALLDALHLEHVLDLGRGVFAGTRVETCVTVWRSRSSPGHRARTQGGSAPTYQLRRSEGRFEPSQLGDGQSLAPAGPAWLLRPIAARAKTLDAAWRERGEPITELFPVHLPGLKTRFDELLVDSEPERLVARLRAFVTTPLDGLAEFAEAHHIPSDCLEKLRALRRALPPQGLEIDAASVRPFFRYAGAKHRGRIPLEARAYCYLDRRLIPRGDHRLRGAFDPHRCPQKVVFNVRELPLCAAWLDVPGCVHAHRHARFAPLYVPRAIAEGGLSAARSTAELGSDVPNLSKRGRALAETLGGPEALAQRVVAFVNSPLVQEHWAKSYGAAHELVVPLEPRWLEAAEPGGAETHETAKRGAASS